MYIIIILFLHFISFMSIVHINILNGKCHNLQCLCNKYLCTFIAEYILYTEESWYYTTVIMHCSWYSWRRSVELMKLIWLTTYDVHLITCTKCACMLMYWLLITVLLITLTLLIDLEIYHLFLLDQSMSPISKWKIIVKFS